MSKRVSFFLLLFVGFIDYVGLGLVYPLFPYLFFNPDFHLLSLESSNAERGFYLGVLLAIFSLGQFFGGPILGGYSDQMGRKKILVATLGLGALGYLISVVGIATMSFNVLLFSRLVTGLAGGNASVVQAAISDLSTPKNKTQLFAYYTTALSLGLTLGPFFGGVLSDPKVFHGFTLPFWLGAGTSLLNLLLIALYFKETHFVPRLEKTSLLGGLHDMIKAFYMKGIRALMFSFFVFVYGWSFYFDFFPVYLIREYHFDSTGIGYFYGYSGAWVVLCSALLIMPIIRRFPAKKVLFYSLILTGAYILLFLIVPSPNYFWFYLPPLFYFYSFVFPTTMTLVSDWAGEKMQGEALGIFQSVLAFGWIASTLFSGALLGIYDVMPILVGGGVIILSGAIYGIAYRRKLFFKK